MYGCESWTVKKAEHLRIDAFELWCWRRLLRVPWSARGSNQSILKEISPGCSFGKWKWSRSAQSCPILCDPTDCSLPGSSVHEILQARILQWVAISFSSAWKWKVKVKSLSHVQLFLTPRTVAYQAPLSMGFSRQEYWRGVPGPSPGDLLDPGIEPVFPALQANSLPLSHRSFRQSQIESISSIRFCSWWRSRKIEDSS